MVVARIVIKALESEGWILVSQKGSHMKFKKEGKETIVVPNHPGKDIPNGTLSNIVKSTGINLKKF